MQFKNSGHAQPKQPRAFTCASCGMRHSFEALRGDVKNTYMEFGEYAPLCDDCCARAQVCSKTRQRIELSVLRQCREGVPGVPERVVMLTPEMFGAAE